MALHFSREEFANRLELLKARMKEENLGAMLLFAQESMYWLTGYDTFGFCFFQTLIVRADGQMILLTRAPDLRQARNTSIIDDIRIWVDRVNADPAIELKNILMGLDLLGARIGVEYDTHGLSGRNARLLDDQLTSFGTIVDASYVVSRLRLVKSPAELRFVEMAAEMTDAALDAALPLVGPGQSEAEILAAMQSAVFRAGGDYPANEFILGSGPDALLCRYTSGRRTLDPVDQLTLEWSGASAHYHAPMMRTIVIGPPTERQRELYAAARDAMEAIEKILTPGNTFATVFDTHARIMDERNLARHRLNACGYSVGARFAPTWMEHQMFQQGNPEPIVPDMTLFVHMIIADSDTGTAMTLGQTYLTTPGAPRPLTRFNMDMITV